MRVDILDRSAVDRIADCLSGQYLVIWLIGTSTGLRVSDILNLKVRQALQIKTRVKEIKTGKSRVVYFRQYVRTAVERYVMLHGLRSSDRLFSVSRQSVWIAIKKAANQAGVFTNVGTHSMRKAYSVEHIGKGYSIYDLQRRLNHSHIGDTIGYITSNEALGLKSKRKVRKK